MDKDFERKAIKILKDQYNFGHKKAHVIARRYENFYKHGMPVEEYAQIVFAFEFPDQTNSNSNAVQVIGAIYDSIALLERAINIIGNYHHQEANILATKMMMQKNSLVTLAHETELEMKKI